MKVVIQRSGASSVCVNQEVVGSIKHGLVLLVCVEKDDLEETMLKAAQKVLNIRMFNDSNQRMNLNINQVDGEILAISQFTLSWQGLKGNRPGFDASMPPEEAQRLFNLFCDELKKSTNVATGVFGAEMDVAISNQGPVTFSLEF